MAVDLGQFYDACPGVIATRSMEAALAALDPASSPSAIQAVILPLMPEGNPPQYTKGAPPAMPLPMPGATPTVPPALPPQPEVAVPVSGGANPRLGTVMTFAKGMRRFADSNPDPIDGWSIERDEDLEPTGPR